MNPDAEHHIDDRPDRIAIRKKDWLLALVMLLAAGVLFLVIQTRQHGSGAQVEIRVNGKLQSAYPLSQNRTVQIRTEYGANVAEIEDGAVWISDADCPGHDCISQGRIARRGEMIVCLPHRLVIEITGDPDADGTVPANTDGVQPGKTDGIRPGEADDVRFGKTDGTKAGKEDGADPENMGETESRQDEDSVIGGGFDTIAQ